ncbi:hypothetical protein ACF0H5_010685 [Mactra antiquata]
MDSVKYCGQYFSLLTSAESLKSIDLDTDTIRRSKLLCELYSEDDGIFVENNVNTGPCVFVRKATFEPQTPAACMSCNGWETCDPESNETPCGIIECQKLMLPFGNLRGNLRTVGSRVKFSCNGNYIEVENMVYTTCEENGRWSYVPRCITASCSDATPYYSMENVAFGKPVTLSTTHVNYLTQPHEGSLMVDGNIDQNILSCAHTLNEDLNDIITLDLGQSYTIYALRIYNRLEDCCVDWLSDVKISIGDSLDDMQLHVYHMGPVGTICSFVTVQPCTGRYIEITRNENVNPLVICELQVYGEIIAHQVYSGIIAPYND